MPAPRHVFQTHIRATPEAVWQALTDPDFTRRYFHRTAVDSTWERGAGFRMILPNGADAVEGIVEEVDPPRRLVVTWHVLYDAEMAEEPPSRVEWLIAPSADGVTRVTTIHRDLALSPKTSEEVGYGWTWVLDSMKSFLETGEPLPGDPLDPPSDESVTDDAEAEAHRRDAIDANNSTWELLVRDDLSADEADDMLGRAYTAAHHWRRAARRGPENAARASWLLSRVHASLGHGDVALHHADRCAAARRRRRVDRLRPRLRPRGAGAGARLHRTPRRGGGRTGRGAGGADRRRRGPLDRRERPQDRAVVRPRG